eukprot:TRINITY_DN859_c0_g2_i1.p1 TRINITY_DN859_c0_g2~~TRINITY_DN859_c0_g2_i1.p1  ORF type:complete len:275 (-),score=95.99 TRINITY_DN859_c0_g2_i1:1014-1838(-)
MENNNNNNDEKLDETENSKKLLKEFKTLLKSNHNGCMPFSYTPFDLLQLTLHIPRVFIDPSFRNKVENVDVRLCTEIGNKETEHVLGDGLFHAIATSTYPSLDSGRVGEPVCDQYDCYLTEDFQIICIADGCNWGPPPATAAKVASETFVNHILENRENMYHTRQLAQYCVSGIAKAHNEIIKKKKNEPKKKKLGTTTLIGGVMVKLKPKKIETSISGGTSLRKQSSRSFEDYRDLQNKKEKDTENISSSKSMDELDLNIPKKKKKEKFIKIVT